VKRALLALAMLGSGCIDWETLSDSGCSDGEREGLAQQDDLAACAGAWTVPGALGADDPACGRSAGDDAGGAAGCNMQDLCADGWHVCLDAGEVATRDGAAGCAELGAASDAVFITRQRGDAAVDSHRCAPAGSSDDVFGCGGLGAAVSGDDACTPLDRRLSLPVDCPAEGGWTCGSGEAAEGATIAKSDPARGGGVLCCRD
jgi:hypothetical protein